MDDPSQEKLVSRCGLNTGGPDRGSRRSCTPRQCAYGYAQGTEVVLLQCVAGGHPCKPEVYKLLGKPVSESWNGSGKKELESLSRPTSSHG